MPTKKKDLMDNIMSGKIDLNKYKPKAKKPKFIKGETMAEKMYLLFCLIMSIFY